MHFFLTLRWRDSESSIHVGLHTFCWTPCCIHWWKRKFQGAKVPHLELSLPEVNGLGSEKPIVLLVSASFDFFPLRMLLHSACQGLIICKLRNGEPVKCELKVRTAGAKTGLGVVQGQGQPASVRAWHRLCSGGWSISVNLHFSEVSRHRTGSTADFPRPRHQCRSSSHATTTLEPSDISATCSLSRRPS